MTDSPVQNLTDLTRGKVAASTAAVARGQRPIRRLSAPAVPPATARFEYATMKWKSQAFTHWGVRSDTLPLMFVSIGRTGLTYSTAHGTGSAPQQVPAGEGLDTLTRAWLDTTGLMLVLTDRTAAARLITELSRSMLNEMTRDRHTVANQVRMAMTLPFSTRLVILTDAAERTFWTPAQVTKGDFAAWSRVLGATAATTHDAMPAVLAHVLSGEASKGQQKFARAAVGSEHSAIGSTGFVVSAGRALSSFSSAEMAQTAWETYRDTDPAGIIAACSSGTAPVATPLGVDGATVSAVLSSPCRIKPGNDVKLFDRTDGAEIGAARLVRLEFDDDLGLIGVFSTSRESVRSAEYGERMGTRSSSAGEPRSLGYRWLVNGANSRGQRAGAFIVVEPFLASNGAPSSWWLDAKSAERPAVRRDIPLDVALAGAGA